MYTHPKVQKMTPRQNARLAFYVIFNTLICLKFSKKRRIKTVRKYVPFHALCALLSTSVVRPKIDLTPLPCRMHFKNT